MQINNLFARLAEWVLDHRLIVIIICLLMVTGGAFLSQKIRIENTAESYFLDDDSSYVYYQNFMQEFGNDEFIYIVYRTRQGIFDLDALRKTKSLVKDLEEIPYVEKVNAINNIEILEGSKNGELMVYGLMDEFPSSQAKANLLIKKLLDGPLYVNGYISEEAKFVAILCEMEDRPKDDRLYHKKIGDGLKSVLSKPEYKNFEFWSAGEPVINSEFQGIMNENLRSLGGVVVVKINLTLR